MKISTNCWSLLELGMIFFFPLLLPSCFPSSLLNSPKENFKYQIKRESKNIFSLVNLTRLVQVFGFGGGSGFIELAQNKPAGLRGLCVFRLLLGTAPDSSWASNRSDAESTTPKWS